MLPLAAVRGVNLVWRTRKHRKMAATMSSEVAANVSAKVRIFSTCAMLYTPVCSSSLQKCVGTISVRLFTSIYYPGCVCFLNIVETFLSLSIRVDSGRMSSMSAAVDVGRMPIEVTGRGRAAPKCGVASA